MAPHGRAPFKWPVLWGTALQQSPASCLEHSPDFPRACTPWKSLPPICLAYMLPQWSPALVFVSSTWSSQAVSHPSTIQAQCCLTSELKWELVFPTWHGPLTAGCTFVPGADFENAGCPRPWLSFQADMRKIVSLHQFVAWRHKPRPKKSFVVKLRENGPQATREVSSPGGGIDDQGVLLVGIQETHDSSKWLANLINMMLLLLTPLQMRNSWSRILSLTATWKGGVPMTPRSMFPAAWALTLLLVLSCFPLVFGLSGETGRGGSCVIQEVYFLPIDVGGDLYFRLVASVEGRYVGFSEGGHRGPGDGVQPGSFLLHWFH